MSSDWPRFEPSIIIEYGQATYRLPSWQAQRARQEGSSEPKVLTYRVNAQWKDRHHRQGHRDSQYAIV